MSIKNNFPSIRPSLSLHFAKTKKLDPRIDFTRASTGTYYDGETVAKAEENLLTYSEQFDNDYWNKLRINPFGSGSVANTTATTDPLGGNNADYIQQQNSGTFGGVTAPETFDAGITRTFSVFAKAAEANFVAIASNNGVNRTWFNLSNGSIGITASSHIANIQSIGNGWYRCSITTNTNQPKNIYIAEADGSLSVTSGNGIYIWGAQVEQRASLTAYTPTTDQPITRYQPVLLSAPANTARFDHDPVTGESEGLLIEEQRTNLVLRSEELTNAYWTNSATSINRTANQNIAPDGALTADLLEANVNNGLLYRNLTLSASTSYSFSVYLKKSTASSTARLQVSNLSNSVFISQSIFDLATGTVTSTTYGTASITDVGNGWYRCSVSGTSSTAATYRMWIVIDTSGHAYFAWGAQLEQGSFPTSYIKTEGSQVTRSADSASITGENFSSWYRVDEGTLYAESNSSSTAFPFVVKGNSSNYIGVISKTGTDAAQIYKDGVIQGRSGTSTLNSKIVLSYASNYLNASVDGEIGVADTTIELPTVSTAFIGNYDNSSLYQNGHIKKISYYPERLTNEQLQSLTKD